MLSHFFVVYLPQDSAFTLGEELGLQSPAHHPQDSSCPSLKAGPSGQPGEELDLSFLPDELSTPDDTGSSLKPVGVA